MKRLVLLLALVLGSSALNAQANREVKAASATYYATQQSAYMPEVKYKENAKVRNVILMIGDGMGLGAVNAALFANGGQLTMTNLPAVGFVRTQSADNFVTDSAASGTAYATGHKTNNGYVGVDPDGQVLANLPEKLMPLGYACGVLSTDDMTGATPAAFYAHQAARTSTTAIWGDLPYSSLVFASAGTKKNFEMLESKLQDDIRAQFDVVFSAEDASDAAAQSERLAFFPESVSGDRGDYLPATTALAIEYLSARSKRGFFLVVEGARIDKEEHSNHLDGTVKEALDFDKAIEVAVRFAEKDGHTLVVISADHETGALTTSKGDPKEGFIAGTFASKGHSSMMVPLFAYGPGSKQFICVQENSDVSNKILSMLDR